MGVSFLFVLVSAGYLCYSLRFLVGHVVVLLPRKRGNVILSVDCIWLLKTSLGLS